MMLTKKIPLGQWDVIIDELDRESESCKWSEIMKEGQVICVELEDFT